MDYSEIAAEMQEENRKEESEKWRNECLAKFLNLSDAEMENLSYEIHTSRSKDGDSYGYEVIFDVENSSKQIIDKIEGLENGCSLFLPPLFFELEDNDSE